MPRCPWRLTPRHSSPRAMTATAKRRSAARHLAGASRVSRRSQPPSSARTIRHRFDARAAMMVAQRLLRRAAPPAASVLRPRPDRFPTSHSPSLRRWLRTALPRRWSRPSCTSFRVINRGRTAPSPPRTQATPIRLRAAPPTPSTPTSPRRGRMPFARTLVSWHAG